MYEYNEFGDISSVVQQYREITTIGSITYEYDSHQNWIKKKSIAKVMRNDEEEKTEIGETIRTIEYYE